MQEMLYYDAPYLVTVYEAIGEAWRTDRVACMRPQPDPGGVYLVQYGVYNYIHARPASEADQCADEEGVTQASGASSDDGGGISTGVLVAGGVVLLVLLGVGGVVAMRRRGTVGDRE
jgi:peptide/nickel transport system substrate-binding protein